MSKQQVLFIGDLNHSLPEFKKFQQKYECLEYTLTTRDQFIQDLKTRFSHISAIYGAWLGFVPISGLRTVIDYVPPSLKVVAFCSVGYDHQDAQELTQRGIAMTNVPSDGAAEPVSDLVVYYTITAFRQLHMYAKHHLSTIPDTIDLRYKLANEEFNTREGKLNLSSGKGYDFGEKINQRPNLSPRGHNAVIVGFGQIGQLIGKKLSSLGMNIAYVKRAQLTTKQENDLGYKAKYAPTILDAAKQGQVDLVVIACPATPETHHLINEDVIDSIPNPFRIVNIGRGTVIDEQALLDGLDRGKILFAGLDVFENEPAINERLINREDVVLTPHIGASTLENFDYTAVKALENIDNILDGGAGVSRVN
ncbi:hypothetical protein KGF57_002448 [Candida theae]|uniref:D-isomer specific 2-hydroxyacid dehydrogenase NAD-binding domain-containing protein n=1 Tax=Candida theae TaxID=1198502 RepID=A0AAD5BF12_9ASCO|nr:uncharacterized protein KGF57_002448 [Candida theae]KAI5958603.1 hypothetical protein KGF57_002448 [Candida theae]